MMRRNQGEQLKSKNPRIEAHAKIFYGQIGFTLITFVLGTRALLSQHIPFFAWLPALLLLFDATLSLASLLYLDFTLKNTTSYIRLTLSLVIFRFSCAIILGAELFLPHSDPTVSVPLIFLSIINCAFSMLASVQVHKLTNLELKTSNSQEGYKLQTYLGSQVTLVTNVDEDS